MDLGEGKEELGQGGWLSPDTCAWSSKLHDMLRALQCLSVLYWAAVTLGKALGWDSSLPLSMWNESNCFNGCSAELGSPREI